MLARKHHKTKGIPIPDEWTIKVSSLLNSVYSQDCKKLERRFEAFGQIFEDELVVIVALISTGDKAVMPVTCYLSTDINNQDDPNEKLGNLLDMAGVIFDNILAQKEWNDYETEWTEHAPKQGKKDLVFYYRVTREDVGLTIKANELLKEEN